MGAIILNWSPETVTVFFLLVRFRKARRVRPVTNKQWRAEGGANGAPAPGIQNRGASKEWNYKYLNVVSRRFSLL